MGIKETCEKCGAFSALTSECRRKAPIAVVANANGRIQVSGAWPATIKTNWCAEFFDEAGRVAPTP